MTQIKDPQQVVGKESKVTQLFPLGKPPLSSREVTPRISVDPLLTLRNDLEQARSYYQQGNYDQAKEALLQIIGRLESIVKQEDAESVASAQITLLSATARTVQGLIYEALRQDEKAQEAFRQAVDLFVQCWPQGEEVVPGQAYGDYGIALHMIGRIPEAIDSLNAAVKIGIATPEVYRHLGSALKEQERYEDAEKWLNEALKQNSRDSLAHQALAELLDIQGRLEEAVKAMEQAGQLDKALDMVDRTLVPRPDNAEMLTLKGKILGQLGRSEEALQALDQALMCPSDDTEALRIKGLVLYTLNRYEEALEILEQALSLNPKDARIWGGKGRVLRALNRKEEAVEALQYAVELDPERNWVQAELGETLRLLGRNEEALQALDKALDKEPDNAWALATKGQVLWALNRKEEAVEALRQAIERDPTWAWAQAELGRTLWLLDRNEEALQALDKALALEPDYAFALRVEGNILREIGEYQKAVEMFDRAIRLDSSDISNFTDKVLALWYFGTERRQEIRRAYQEIRPAYEAALRSDPQNLWGHVGLGEMLYLLDDMEGAKNEYRWIIKQVKERGQELKFDFNLLSWCHYRLENYDEAIRLLRESLSLDAEDPSTQFNLALVFMCSERYDLAFKEYERGLEFTNQKPILQQRGLLSVALVDLKEAVKAKPALEKVQKVQEALVLLENALAKATKQVSSRKV